MLLHRWGSLSSISGPERPRQPPYLTERAIQVSGGSTKWSNHSDVSTVFAEIWHPSPWLDCALISFLFLSPLFPPVERRKNVKLSNQNRLCFHACSFQVSSDLFPGTLWFFWDLLCGVFGHWVEPASLIKPAFYHLLHPSRPLYTASPLCYALLLLSFSLFPLSPVISHFSWTPTMRYSVYRHRYGRLSLLTVSTLIPACAFPVSSVPFSLSNQQEGSLLLCGLHLLNAPYKLLINFLFPLGNKAT